MNKQKLISAALVCCIFSSIAAAQQQISNELLSNAAGPYSAAQMKNDVTTTTEEYLPTYAVPYIILYQPEDALYVGDSFKLLYSAYDYDKITWESSDTKIAEVDSHGTVTLKSPGTVTITATASSPYINYTSSDTISLTVYPQPTTEAPTYEMTVVTPYIQLNKPKDPLFAGDSFKISYSAYSYDKITWKSSDTKIADVDSNGAVFLKSPGTVTITATASLPYISYTSSDSVSFTVNPQPTTEAPTYEMTMPMAYINLYKPKEPLFVGDSFKISYSADFYENITWESSDTKIAEVDSSGKVTLKSAGTVKITATVSSKYLYNATSSDSVSFTVTSLEPNEPDSTNFSYEVLYDGTIKLTDYTGKSNNIYIPDDIKGIAVKDMDIFSDKTNVVKVSVAGSLYAVPKDAFSKLNYLRFAEIRDGVKAINSGAFSSCSALETVTIPDSVILIADDAFNSDFKGTIEYFSTDSEAYKYAAAHGFKTARHIEKYDEVSYVYENDDQYIKIIDCDETAETIVIPSQINGKPVLEIGEKAFSNCSALTEITVPSSVKSIGDSAFSDCYALDKITIENPNCIISDSTLTIYNIMDDNGKTFFNGTIYGYENSTAQKYAEKYNRRFVSLGSAPASNIVSGDANCDGQITIADATAILQSLGNPDKYSLSAEGKANADCCNPGDGVNTSDALAIQKLDAKIITSLPEITKK